MSDHYGGRDVNTKFQDGESWKKVFGPVMVYVNSASSDENAYDNLWEDAKRQVSIYTLSQHRFQLMLILIKKIASILDGGRSSKLAVQFHTVGRLSRVEPKRDCFRSTECSGQVQLLIDYDNAELKQLDSCSNVFRYDF